MKALLIRALVFGAVFWNLENYYDWQDGGTSASDSEFSSRGARHWTRKRFNTKTQLIAKTLLWADAPAVAGFAELENSRVLKELVRSEVLRKYGYRFVHYDSPDPRGIDVGLIYRPDAFDLVMSYPVHVDSLATRDILYACMQDRASGEIWHFFVNHHPSKYGGSGSSKGRMMAMQALARSVDSLVVAGQTNIVAMGDFNDVPGSEAFSIMDGRMLNLGLGIREGSIRYQGDWQLIDNFLVSPQLGGKTGMEVLRPPFLSERDRQYPGDKPRRTYVGPRYNGGVSDHLPVRLNLP